MILLSVVLQSCFPTVHFSVDLQKQVKKALFKRFRNLRQYSPTDLILINFRILGFVLNSLFLLTLKKFSFFIHFEVSFLLIQFDFFPLHLISFFLREIGILSSHTPIAWK